MEIITRAMTDKDQLDCIFVEESAIPGFSYLGDAWDLFVHKTKGDLTGAIADGKVRGIGKFTHLYGDYGWLETLRVHPDYQGKGLGKAIYVRYLEEMKKLGLNAIGMYTSTDNDKSKGLAERFGLSLQGRFSEFHKPVAATSIADNMGFQPVSAEEGETVLSPHYNKMGEFVVLNRTFYPVKEGLGEHFAKEGWVYKDNAGNLIVIGARFQPQKAQHIAYMSGDCEKLFTFANSLAFSLQCQRLTAMRSYHNAEQRTLLEQNGFEIGVDNIITLWMGL